MQNRPQPPNTNRHQPRQERIGCDESASKAHSLLGRRGKSRSRLPNTQMRPWRRFLDMVNPLTAAEPRFPCQRRSCRLSALRNRYLSTSRPGSMAHIIDDPIDEELLPGNRLGCFHPTRPGQLLDGRFKTIAKLGFDAGSTVWLAENVKL
jgi:hypothetical protein